MQKITKILFITASINLAACGAKQQGSLAEKKAELDKLKKEQSTITANITKLETEIAKLDTSAVKEEKTKLVAVEAVNPSTFIHNIDLQGKIESENISYITPRGQGGQVKALYIKKGDVVKKGQLILQLDDIIARRSVAATQKGIETIKTQLAFAKDLYQKQKNLWSQNIGTEVQLITAKNSVDNLENQLKNAEEQAKITDEQLKFTSVYSDVDGIAEDVNIRVGELFAGAGQIKIVNTEHLKVTTQVPENYLNKVKIGTPVAVILPDLNISVNTSLNVAGKLIDPNSRSFFIEAKIPSANNFRPNQIAVVKIQDYVANNAITVPVNTLQTDEKGKYVLVAVKEKNKLVARKKQVVVGELYADKLEIKSGLQKGDLIITDGYQSLYEGQAITTETK